MLLTKEVKILLKQGTRYKHYESKGYVIPKEKLYYEYFDKRRGKIHKSSRWIVQKDAFIMVKVEDLPKGSNQKVQCKCDICGKISWMQWGDYLNHNHNGYTYCQKCGTTLFISGENHYKYNHNKTIEERKIERNYPEYREFVKKVMARDKYTCQCCGKTGYESSLEVHHLNGYDWFKEGRIDETNGITLCIKCHDNFHSVYGKGRNTRMQFKVWMNNSLKELEKYNGELPTSRKAYCIEDNSVINNVKVYAKENNIPYSNLYNCCNGNTHCVGNKHYIWYDKYEKISEKELLRWLSIQLKSGGEKPVVCLNNGKIFKSATKAALYYGFDKTASGIVKCCKGKIKTYGKDINTNQLFKWCYLGDYILDKGIKEYCKMIKEELLEI